MFKRKLCLGINSQFGLSDIDQIRLFKKVGFEGFFWDWQRGKDVLALKAAGEEEGMIFQSIHAPFGHASDLWEADKSLSDPAVDELLTCLADTAAAGVPILVLHAIIGFDRHSPSAIGVQNYQKIVDSAEKLQVKLAFENTEGEEYLALLMSAFSDRRHVGFCWDSGHELCYNAGRDMLALYGDRLFCTHLNDNLGIRDYDGRITFLDDLHLLPFDGIADWNKIAKRLKHHGFSDMLTFELNTESKPGRHENDMYGRMAPVDYLTEAYKRACRVAALLERMP